MSNVGSHNLASHELEAYLDEALPVEQMARIESLVRDEPELAARLAQIVSRRDTGLHSLGEIWRRHRLSCPPRGELGSYVLGVLEEGPAEYIRFHVEVIGCRICQANLADLKMQPQELATASRRRKYFASSAGSLPKKSK